MTTPRTTTALADRRIPPTLIALAWLWVAFPSGYGIWQLFTQVTRLFGA